jgi:hypothetical protein
MARHMVKDDIESGALAKIRMQVRPTVGAGFSMHAISIRRTSRQVWLDRLVDRLKQSRNAGDLMK